MADENAFGRDLDNLIESAEEYMETRRWELGIDDDLVKRAGLSAEEVSALESHQGYSAPLTQDQQTRLNAAIVRLLAVIRLQGLVLQRLRAELDAQDASRRSSRLLYLVLAAVFIGLFAITKFSSVDITVQPEGPEVIAVESSWWGLGETRRTIKWMQPRGYRVPAWMAKDAKGEWYPYIVEDPWEAE